MHRDAQTSVWSIALTPSVEMSEYRRELRADVTASEGRVFVVLRMLPSFMEDRDESSSGVDFRCLEVLRHTRVPNLLQCALTAFRYGSR